MRAVTLFEAKAHLSEVVRQVAALDEAIVLTVRGKPMVKLVPYHEDEAVDAWSVRERTLPYGPPELELPARTAELPENPFEGE